MQYQSEILNAANDPAELEGLYRQAVKTNHGHEFALAMFTCQLNQPDNLLLMAWYHRLYEPAKTSRAINWTLAVVLALFNGLLFGLLVGSDQSPQFVKGFPFLFLTAGPSTSLAIIAYLYFTQREQKNSLRLLILGGLFAAALIYVNVVVPNMKLLWREQATGQMLLHFLLFAWCSIGLFLLGLRSTAAGQEASSQGRFAFLIKSLEIFTVSGLALIAGGIFFAVSIGLFSTLNVTIPDSLARFVAAGGVGMIPVLAVAWIYDPNLSPAEQDFQQGISRILATLTRILVVPTLLVGVAYVVLIPFNFMAPFEYRDVLIAYNAMLFAVLGLLLAATPIRMEELSEKTQKLLRIGIMVIAGLAVIVSVYALAAILYRTFVNGLTVNRLVVIGWNLINTFILSLLIFLQTRNLKDRRTWVDALKKTYGIAATCYVIWTGVVIVVVPLLFFF